MPISKDKLNLPELGLEKIRMDDMAGDLGLNEIFDNAIKSGSSVRFLRLAGPKAFRKKVIAHADKKGNSTAEYKKLLLVEDVEFILTNPYSESFLTRMDAERKDNWNIWRVREEIIKFAKGLMEINEMRFNERRKPIKIAFHCMDLVWNLSIVENQHVIARAYYKSASGHDRNVAEVHLCTGKGSRIAESFISYYDSIKNDKRTQFIEKFGEPESSLNSLRKSLGKWPSLFKCNSIHIDNENDEYFVKACCSKHGMLAEKKVFDYQRKSQQANGYFKPVEGTIDPHEDSYRSRILKINGVLASEFLWHAQQAFIHNSDLNNDLEQMVGSIVSQAFSALNEFRNIGKKESKSNEKMVPYPWEKNIHDALSEAGRFLHLTQQELSECSTELLKIADKSGRQPFRDAHLKNRIIRFDKNILSNNYENFHTFFEKIKENNQTIYDWLKKNTYDIDFETGCWFVSEWDDVFHILWSNSLGWNLSGKLEKDVFEFVKKWYRVPESEEDKEDFWSTLLCRSLREYCRRIWYDHVMPRTYSQRYKLERRDHFLELAKTAFNNLKSYIHVDINNPIQKFLDDCTDSKDDLWNCPINHKYLFCWDSVTENENLNENHILKNYLIDYHGINWVENAKIKKSKNGEKIWVTSEYLIEWDKIPKNQKLSKNNDNLKLIDFLNKIYCIDWIKTAIIEKKGNNIVKLSNEKKSLCLIFEDSKLIIEIDGNRVDEFDATNKNIELKLKMFGKMELHKNTENAHLEINGTIIETFKIEINEINGKIYIENNRLKEPNSAISAGKTLIRFDHMMNNILEPINDEQIMPEEPVIVTEKGHIKYLCNIMVKHDPKDISVRLEKYDFENNKDIKCFKVAIVQLKYHLFKKSILYIGKYRDEDGYEKYKNKILKIIKYVADKADIIIFPEYSIPFEILKDIKDCFKNCNITIVAGSHYIIKENFKQYKDIFYGDFKEDRDLRKNISPVIIPGLKKILHTEKVLGAEIERPLFNKLGMTNGQLIRIFKFSNNVTFGILICFDYLIDDLKCIINYCDYLLIPQTNTGTDYFNNVSKKELMIPRGPGKKAYFMANGIFIFKDQDKMEGGESGVFLTLDRSSQHENGIIKSVKNKNGQFVKEQFIQIANLNTIYDSSRQNQQAQVPITTQLIHIFEENEIKSEFLKLLDDINNPNNNNIEQLLMENMKLISEYSPLMYENLKELKEGKLDEIRNGCKALVV